MKKLFLHLLLFLGFGASAEWAVNLQQPITEVGESIYNLHLVIPYLRNYIYWCFWIYVLFHLLS